ncbi:PAAR domain-containing protein [Xenorhabdus bovienii]|uniref:PAAR domain-containing protein n=1 Tax=Xenorhabdus bovienii TaxID=40576 RepID=UPI0023B2B332|nr:PAAR domain-containing protein [Xenorhabdus bovienii]MDE9543478.1 PAAR domain-containing protein [Xenorhabdus bovienii]MDE9563967.1 PAAR domain-containing protein [Xenorhabdus bovienii]
MAGKVVIRLNDTTDHGGKVITAIDSDVYQGVPIAGKGDLVSCPKCKGVFPVVEESGG